MNSLQKNNNVKELFGFSVGDCIGEGTFGKAFFAHQKNSGVDCCIKIIDINQVVKFFFYLFFNLWYFLNFLKIIWIIEGIL